MAIDTTTPRTRRALLAGALGGLAGVAAHAIGKPDIARAGAGAVMLGAKNNSADRTTIENTTDNSTVLLARNSAAVPGNGLVGESAGGGVGVTGRSATGIGVSGSGLRGVVGSGSGFGIQGQSDTGVGVAGASETGAGVHGFSTESEGVAGSSDTGIGVWGFSSSGTGLRGSTADGYALQTFGRLALQGASGLAIIPAGSKSVSVQPAAVVNTFSFVLVSAMSNPRGRHLWATTKGPTANTITIHLSFVADVPFKVSWLMLERLP